MYPYGLVTLSEPLYCFLQEVASRREPRHPSRLQLDWKLQASETLQNEVRPTPKLLHRNILGCWVWTSMSWTWVHAESRWSGSSWPHPSLTERVSRAKGELAAHKGRGDRSMQLSYPAGRRCLRLARHHLPGSQVASWSHLLQGHWPNELKALQPESLARDQSGLPLQLSQCHGPIRTLVCPAHMPGQKQHAQAGTTMS